MKTPPKADPPPSYAPLIFLALLALIVAAICWRCHIHPPMNVGD